MPLDDRHVWALLRELDDPDNLEFPRDYDRTATRARFNELVTRLNLSFDCMCEADREVQDASRHGTITIPASATASQDHITITVSNFGDLVAVTLGNPGAYDAEEELELLLPNDRDRIDHALDELSYVVVPHHLLEAAYDGASDSLKAAYPGGELTWWIRYFDYI